jgi:REP element-mobilizing transposase RayT
MHATRAFTSRGFKRAAVPARLRRVPTAVPTLTPPFTTTLNMDERLPKDLAVWHITFGTYGSRLHGGEKSTVDRQHNQTGSPVLDRDEQRRSEERNRMRGDPIYLSAAQRDTIESVIPTLCPRGRWNLYACAAPSEPDNNHVHIVLDADPSADPKAILKLIKRWLTQELDKHFPRPTGNTWWAKGGSTKPVNDQAYFSNVIAYVRRQRTTR